MNIKDKAKNFAIQAHKNQVRKSEPEKPMIIHPIGVGNLLEEYGYDDNVIAAGYLHDVVEDTKYTIEDIHSIFGSDIVTLVLDASEPDKTLSWQERKEHSISHTKKLSLRNKLVICADKINNLEDLMLMFQKKGYKDFSAFKANEESIKWYYTSMYESLICNEDKNLPIFEHLKNVLDIVFYNKENLYLKNTIFSENNLYYNDLIKLHAKKNEIKKLKQLVNLSKPIVIEFSGTPRTGKTTIINNLCDFFKKGNFNTDIVKEFTTSKYYKEEICKKYSISTSQIYELIIDYVYQDLIKSLDKDSEIIILDRSLNDRQIWNYNAYKKDIIPKNTYIYLKDKYQKISKDIINLLVITKTDPLTSLKRDYFNSLALEPRSYLNEENIDTFNNGLDNLKNLFIESVDKLITIDTTNLDIKEITINITNQILDYIREIYIEALNKNFN